MPYPRFAARRAASQGIPVLKAPHPPASLSAPTFPRVGRSSFFSAVHRLMISHLRYRTKFRLPYVGRVLLDGSVARELARARNIQNGCASPRTRIGIRLAQPLVRFEIGPQVRQVHVVVSAR